MQNKHDDQTPLFLIRSSVTSSHKTTKSAVISVLDAGSGDDIGPAQDGMSCHADRTSVTDINNLRDRRRLML